MIDEAYSDCLKTLELATPIKLGPLFALLKSLGTLINNQMKENQNRLRCFYPVYILSAGLIDDLGDVLTLIDQNWNSLPIQIHLVNLSTRNIMVEDLDTTKFQDYTMKVNLLRSCWLQFNVHYYDKMKAVYDGGRARALMHLCDVAIDSVPKDIEQYLFS